MKKASKRKRTSRKKLVNPEVNLTAKQLSKNFDQILKEAGVTHAVEQQHDVIFAVYELVADYDSLEEAVGYVKANPNKVLIVKECNMDLHYQNKGLLFGKLGKLHQKDDASHPLDNGAKEGGDL